MSPPIAAVTRTGAQAGPAWIIVEVIDSSIYDMSDRSFGAYVALLTMLIAFLMPIIENHYGRALMRNVYTTQVPVTSKDVIKPRT